MLSKTLLWARLKVIESHILPTGSSLETLAIVHLSLEIYITEKLFLEKQRKTERLNGKTKFILTDSI